MTALLARMEFDAWTSRWVRRLRRRHNDPCVNILTYHSVSKETSIFTDGAGLRHHPDQFERQIDYLAEHHNPVSLRELVSALEEGRTLHRPVVVTFDDGFADSLRQAMPILLRRRIPMTVFAVTSVVGNTDLLWQHKLDWLIAHGHADRVRDALKAEGYPTRDDADALAVFVRQHYRRDLPDILESVVRSVGRRGADLAAQLHPYLEPEEIAGADPEFVDFGNHTDTHAVLSALGTEQQQEEIVIARDAIADLTGRPPIALAYPFGLKRHYNAASRRIVRETGHRAALDLRRRINLRGVSPFDLSRKPAPCGRQSAFEKLVEDWPDNAAIHATRGER